MPQVQSAHGKMNRRSFRQSLVAFSGYLCVWTANPVSACSAPGKEMDTDKLERNLAKLFADREGPLAVGYAYLAICPEIANGALERVRTLLGLHIRGSTAFAEELMRRQQEEFAHSATVVIGGWVLARCEADMCAALVLLSTE